MRKLLTVAAVLIANLSFGQQAITWNQLAKVSWYSAYIPSMGGTFKLPKFSKEVNALNGKTIAIKGFYVPIDGTAQLFALSETPSNMCFFCNGAGPETVMEIWTKTQQTYFKHLRTDKYIELKGILKINKGDPNHMMYILKDAELVKEIK